MKILCFLYDELNETKCAEFWREDINTQEVHLRSEMRWWNACCGCLRIHEVSMVAMVTIEDTCALMWDFFGRKPLWIVILFLRVQPERHVCLWCFYYHGQFRGNSLRVSFQMIWLYKLPCSCCSKQYFIWIASLWSWFIFCRW